MVLFAPGRTAGVGPSTLPRFFSRIFTFFGSTKCNEKRRFLKEVSRSVNNPRNFRKDNEIYAETSQNF
jgi:hypothetical protein